MLNIKRYAILGPLIALAVAGSVLLARPGQSQETNPRSNALGNQVDGGGVIKTVEQIDAVRNGSLVLPQDKLATDAVSVVARSAPGFELLGSYEELTEGLRNERTFFANADDTSLKVDWQDVPADFDILAIYGDGTEAQKTDFTGDPEDGPANYESRRTVQVSEAGSITTLVVDWRGWTRQVIALDRNSGVMVLVTVEVPGRIPGADRRVEDPYSTGPTLDEMLRIADQIVGDIAPRS